MKKIFILSLLLAPIMVNADTVPVDVLVSSDVPYATATIETGDDINAVSASYVKGAYNAAITAVNEVKSNLESKGITALTTGGSNTSVKVGIPLETVIYNQAAGGSSL